MKKFITKTAAAAFASLILFACEQENAQAPIEPLKAKQDSDLVGYDPTTCNLIQSFGSGNMPRPVGVIEENGATIIVKAQKRDKNGKYLKETEAVLLNPSDPAVGLINTFDAQMLGVYGLLTVGDASGTGAHQQGGRLIFDFSPVGAVTMKTMVLTDIDDNEKGSKIELFSATGQLLDQKEIPGRGDDNGVIVSFDNIPGVAKAIVTFGAERSNIGSGAVARLQFCITGQGPQDNARYDDVHTIWLQYTGNKPANVKVTAKQGATDKEVFSEKGMKPGTMFKIAVPAGGSIGETLTIETNRKEVQVIPTGMDRDASLNKQYGSFKVIEARSTMYPLKLN